MLLKANLPASPKRNGSLVRRHSRAAGRCEGGFWRRTNQQEVRQILLAARRYELAEREPGSRNGPLGSVAIEVLQLFANLVDFRTGRLEPSIDTLMHKLRRSRDAVVRALKALRDHGFLDWLRRYEPTGNTGRGPQVKQTSNAYRLSLPERARRLLWRMGVKSPLPEDYELERQAKSELIEAFRGSVNIEERTLFDVGDTPLGRALARLGKSINQRESARQTESHPSFIPYEKR
ncbi:helix-turn-helix domain-containing protein [Neorhizobium sp. T786]|uniref:helix-turn-helix domain-containing protein n=1 Tax=Pseudorhizobium xiangyangii TaxID=2883104 RepID=UPI001CFFF2DD|nr:helix-turn-helix domain-containing protein [Neorhizobium xiangyangii]